MEMLEELAGAKDKNAARNSPEWKRPLYKQAEVSRGLVRVGGKKWVKSQKEDLLLERFNMLLPHSGQDYGIASPRFGPVEKAKTTKDLNALFHQTAVEIFTLQSVQMDPVIPSGWGKGNDVTESWTKNVELHWSPTHGVTLTNPDPMTSAQFLTSIYVPKEKIPGVSEAIKEMKQLESTSTASPPSTKTEGESLDLASETIQKVEGAVEKTKDAISSFQSIENASAGVQNELSTLRQSFLDHAITASERAVTNLRNQLRVHLNLKASNTLTLPSPPRKPTSIYRHIHLTDPNTKLAFKKRLLELTGHNIPDVTLYTAHTLADIHKALFALAQPLPKTVSAKMKLKIPPHPAGKRVPSVLTTMQNVSIHARKIRQQERERSNGLAKVIKYALAERNLLKKSDMSVRERKEVARSRQRERVV